MNDRKKPSAVFAIVFMLALAAIALGVYLAFSSYQRGMAEQRKEESAKNLARIGLALNSFAEVKGTFPERSADLAPFLEPRDLIHPSWPEQPGYVYLPGVRYGSDDENTLLAYENVPERKRKLGIQVLFMTGKIETMAEADFIKQLAAQELAWKMSGRVWRPETMSLAE